MKAFFRNHSRELEDEIDAYLKAITRGSLVFKEGINEYVEGKEEAFEKRVKEMTVAEKEADDKLKRIKYKLYAYNLIPEASGDILELTDALDEIVDRAKAVHLSLSIEKPIIPDFARESFISLNKASCEAADELMKGVRSFFQNTGMVEDHVAKVYFYEGEADKLEEEIARQVFSSQEINRLSHKMHLRYFVERIASISDIAEDVALKLSVFQLKRNI
ncbi:hypothetical protein SAMN05192551_10673 [Tindallia magadiensis]|uniref:Phosphate transport system protein n=1 Tax=Tindallia magadiensis TaxID=69895 RepID=A0A1I3FAX3_9FIRM|nr:DUF47 family protein [Tindallia magadiensis]SFI08329.1 hypothetical protein SAMN05192551_10673 [Tindallia magadiensis]